jgi:hypothetical protein
MPTPDRARDRSNQTNVELDRRRAAAVRLPAYDDAGARDPWVPRRGRTLGDAVDELRSIVKLEIFTEINALRARVAFLESVVLSDHEVGS